MNESDGTPGSSPDDEQTLRSDRPLANRYELLDPIASGGFGTVYKARDLLLKRIVAVKILHPSRTISAETRERFLREARASARLAHDNVVTLFDAGEVNGQLFLVLEYVEGESLGERIAKGPLPAGDTALTVVSIARALDAAHRIGIIHRDIKPANILIRADGHVKVTDFGVARLAGEAELTREGAIIGTLKYMSPEQRRGGHITAASDLFSLGCVAYEMLTGSVPFDDMGQAHVPSPVSASHPALAAVIEQLLRPDPANRPASAAAVIERLQAAPRRASVRPAIAIAALIVVAISVIGALEIARPRSLVARILPVRDAASLVSIIATRTGAQLPAGKATVVRGDLLMFQRGLGRTVIASRPPALTSIAGLSFNVRTASRNSVEIRAPENEIDNAVQAVRLYDELSDYHFEQEPNTIAGTGAASRTIVVHSHGLEPHRLIELIASAANWPLIVDPSAARIVREKLGAKPAPDYDLNAPWDSIAETLMHRYNLAVFRLQRTWILTSLDRYREMNQRRPLITIFAPVPGMSLDDAARAAAAASSPRGTVLVSRRLGGLVITDYSEVTGKQGEILESLGAIGHRFGRQGKVETATYSGAPCDVHLLAGNVRDFMFLIGRLTGLSVVSDPAINETADANFSNVPWDEAIDAVLSVTRTTYSMHGSIVELAPEKEKPREEIVVETIKLEHDDPAFWSPLQKMFQDRGAALIIDENANALIVRDTKQRAAGFRTIVQNLDERTSNRALKRIVTAIEEEGVTRGIALQRHLGASDREYRFNEGSWNQVGYALMVRKHLTEAIEILKDNAAAYPGSSNVYDSLAEAYMTAGQKNAAIENYRKSLALNPRNENAKRMLTKLQS